MFNLKGQLPMVKNSTLFYFYDDFNIENELYESKELTEPSKLFQDEVDKIFSSFEMNPRKEVLEKILNEIL